MAPTINTTKLVATTIATFVSTDKFITLPSIIARSSVAAVFEMFFFAIASEFEVLMDAKTERQKEKYDVGRKKKN